MYTSHTYTDPSQTPTTLHRAPVSPHTETETKVNGGGRSKACLSTLRQNIPLYKSFHSFCLSFISKKITFYHTKTGEKQGGKSSEMKSSLLSDDLTTHLDRPSCQARSHVPRGTHTGSCPRCLHSPLHGTAEDYAHTRRCLTVDENTHTQVGTFSIRAQSHNIFVSLMIHLKWSLLNG